MKTSTILKIIGVVLVIFLLTILTQVGGIIYLLSLLAFPLINKKIHRYYVRVMLKGTAFIALYLVFTFTLVPWLARMAGRVPLPVKGDNLQPLTIMTCLLNRHYVRPELKSATMEVALQMQQQFAGTTMNYLDAGFPFMNGFPLLPHLSHHDGRKLDIAFYYRDKQTNWVTNEVPSPIGYGICEDPLPGETNTAAECAQKGYWQYSVMRKLVPQYKKKQFIFDAQRTAAVVRLFARQQEIKKIFIEPHLKKRLGLTSPKIRFHGCQAVRHDDHLHVQL